MVEDFMNAAIAEAEEGISKGHGGPFGCVVVKDGRIVGRGHNRVLLNHDPTCHGEMEAIRDASRNLKTHDLSGCVIYTTAEPCPMCLGAIMWANITDVYYGCRCSDTSGIGFRDEPFYDQLSGKSEIVKLTEENRKRCLELFRKYQEGTHLIY
jgi:tRNA(Arg) A34 adenosine deaminase TadA